MADWQTKKEAKEAAKKTMDAEEVKDANSDAYKAAKTAYETAAG